MYVLVTRLLHIHETCRHNLNFHFDTICGNHHSPKHKHLYLCDTNCMTEENFSVLDPDRQNPYPTPRPSHLIFKKGVHPELNHVSAHHIIISYSTLNICVGWTRRRRSITGSRRPSADRMTML